MTDRWHDGIYIALGANLTHPASQVTQALEILESTPGISVTARSGLYASSPMGPENQSDYVNAVCAVRSTLAPLALLDKLQVIEQESGRSRDPAAYTRWGPRQLDLDLLLYDQQIINLERLTVPHPGLLLRSFVLVPLLEIAPDIVIPEKGRARDYLESVENFDLKRLPAENGAENGAHR